MLVLAVIPARGGSKGIPRKNVRLMNGKPLIAYAITNALACPDITDVVVSSDDEEILNIGEKFGAIPMRRSDELARDDVTLDPVIYDAVVRMEERRGARYDAVITLQATSPLLSKETLSGAVRSFMSSEYDTFISATNKPHLAWSKNESGFYPLYAERLNRQQLPPNYLEAGAFFISKRENVTPRSRMGKRISVYEIPENEAVDIDSTADWIVCEAELKRKKIVIRCDGHRSLGMGHVYRGLTLAYRLIGHDVIFATRADCELGVEKIKSSFFRYITVEDDADFFRALDEIKPDVIVNDCLDTEKDYVLELKKRAARVVTFEDLGEGAAYADAVINALYDSETAVPRHYFGEKYIDLREEFAVAGTAEVRDEVKEVFVIFGGSDPANLTKKIYRLALERASEDGVHFTFVVGMPYDLDSNGVKPAPGITVLKEVKNVSALMEKSDLAFTSQGRTVFELASVGVPSIVLAQNERELTHRFASMENGFMNLGLGADVSDDTVAKTFDWLCSAAEIRRHMSALMLRHDLRHSIDNVIKIVLGE